MENLKPSVATVRSSRIRIPADVVRYMGLKDGDVLVFEDEDLEGIVKVKLLREILCDK